MVLILIVVSLINYIGILLMLTKEQIFLGIGWWAIIVLPCIRSTA